MVSYLRVKSKTKNVTADTAFTLIIKIAFDSLLFNLNKVCRMHLILNKHFDRSFCMSIEGA
jgi:hypothetical protein